MNAQIKKLYDMAWAETTDHYGTMERFGELIIQECLLALEPNLYESEIEYKVDQAFYKRCERIIKKHFKIE